MDIKDLLDWYYKSEDKGIPRYIEMEDARENQIKIKGRWRKCINAWGIIKRTDGWQYVQTDKKTGRVILNKKFHNGVQVAGYAKGILTGQLSHNYQRNRAVEYAKKKLGYTFSRAVEQVDRLSLDKEAFREFLAYMDSGNFSDSYGNQMEACGYTAYALCAEFNMGPLDACVCMADLRKAAGTKKELLEWLKNVPQKGIPKYIEISGEQAAAGSGWQGKRCVWGIARMHNIWIYAETNRKGRISDKRGFPDECSAVSYARYAMENKIREARHTTPYDKTVKYIQEELGCPKEMSDGLAGQIYACPGIADEFLHYIDTGSFGRGTEIHGYTACVLYRKYGLNPVDAYIYMAHLQKNLDCFGQNECSLSEQAEILERRLEDNAAMMEGFRKMMDRLEIKMEDSAGKKMISDNDPDRRLPLVQTDGNGILTWEDREAGCMAGNPYGRYIKTAKKKQEILRQYNWLKERREKLLDEKDKLTDEYRKTLIRLKQEAR